MDSQLAPSLPDLSEQVLPHQNSRKIFLILGAFLFGIIILAVTVFFIMTRYSSKPQQAHNISPSTVPSLQPSPQVTLSTWEIRLEKTSFTQEEFIPTPGAIPQAGGTAFLIRGKVFGPSSLQNQTLCNYDKNETYIETINDTGSWVRMCDAQIPTYEIMGFYCFENSEPHIDVVASLDSKNDCGVIQDQPETGTYRIRTEIFGDCQKDENGKWENVRPELCKTHEEIFSQKFEVE